MSFIYQQPPPNLGQSLVVDTPDATGPTIAARVINILGNAAGASINENIDNILSYSKTVAAAGTAETATLALVGITPVPGTTYRLGLKRNDTGQVENWYVTANTVSASDLATLFAAAINNVVAGFVSAVASTTNVLLTQVTTTVDCQGFTAPIIPSLGTFTITQAYVASSGTQAEVQQYNTSAAIATYDKYYFLRRKYLKGIGEQTELIDIVWVGHGQTNTAAWEALLDGLLNASAGSSAALLQPFVASA